MNAPMCATTRTKCTTVAATPHRQHAEDDKAIPENKIRSAQKRVHRGGQDVPEPSQVPHGDGEQKHADDESESMGFHPTTTRKTPLARRSRRRAVVV